MTWLSAAWRSWFVSRVVAVVLRYRREIARLKQLLLAIDESADREVNRLRMRHAEEISAAQEEINTLRLEAQRWEALRQDALRTAEDKTQRSVLLYRRMRAIDELADEMPPLWADQVRRHTRPELQEMTA